MDILRLHIRHIHSKQLQQGLSLVEVLLVFAIIGLLVIMGLRFYQSLNRDNQIRQVQFNVDRLRDAMKMYYDANCYRRNDTNGGQIIPGTLNPNNADFETPFVITIANDLQPSGFLTNQFKFVSIPFVDSTAGENGYFMQFNYNESERKICTELNNTSTPTNLPVGATDPNCKTAKTIATIALWKTIIAVQLKATINAKIYLGLLNGDCISSIKNGVIQTCAEVNGDQSGNLIIWERMPTMNVSTNMNTLLNDASLSEFNRIYRTYPLSYLMNTNGDIQTGTSNVAQYFYCGN